MDVKDAILKPMATGAAIYVCISIVAWLLDLVGFNPFVVSGATFNLTAQGIVGLLAFFWAVGWIVDQAAPKIVKFMDSLLKPL